MEERWTDGGERDGNGKKREGKLMAACVTFSKLHSSLAVRFSGSSRGGTDEWRVDSGNEREERT